MASSIASFPVSPLSGPDLQLVWPRRQVIPRGASGGADYEASPLESVALYGTRPTPATSPVPKKQGRGSESLMGGNRYVGPVIEAEGEKLMTRTNEKKRDEHRSLDDGKTVEKLDLLWDDGCGSASVKDYLNAVKEIIRPDGGPPRWFCPVECGQPLKGSPILLFLPGLDGTGIVLILHHKSLGRVFEVRCLHIPIQDRTPFEGLVRLVEETVRLEHASAPRKPIYLVGDSFGATSFGQSKLQSLLPMLEALPDDLHFTVPYILGFLLCNPLKMGMVNINHKHPPRLQLEQLSDNLTAFLPWLLELSDIIPKETVLWKLKPLKSAAAYANSRLHAIRAEVLVLASGKDNMVPSRDEGQRLIKSIVNCRIRHFKDHSHTLLMEEGINLLTVIKGTCLYRRSARHDHILDFLSPSISEAKGLFEHAVRPLLYASSPVLYSTLGDRTIVRGLSGVPSKGPVLLVGYHMLMGFEVFTLLEEFIREKNIMLSGLALPALFNGTFESPTSEFLHRIDRGFLELSPSRHSEEYKCKWPDHQEFVRMAARFGATIVPFGTVGEDDLVECVLDCNDMMKIPFLKDYIRESSRNFTVVREHRSDKEADEQVFPPVVLPTMSGRMYYLFGKAIETCGREQILKGKEGAAELYLQIKWEVEHILAYLLKKREEDPYRNIFDRVVHRVLHPPMREIPGFRP